MNNDVHRIATGTLLGILLCPPPAQSAPIDEFRVGDLEQKVRNLETASREQARQISELQQQVYGNRRPAASESKPASDVPNAGDRRWLTLANWQQIKPGMSEAQVIELLGAPTQLRVADNDSNRILLYAMEIGSSGFLAGKVVIATGRVTVVEFPALK